MKWLKKRLVLAAAIGTAVLLVRGTPAALAASRAEAKPYNIDVIDSISGYASFIGTEENQALNVLEKAVNAEGGIHGRPIHFTYYDDETIPQQAVLLLNRLMISHPAVILGTTLVAQCNAMEPLVKNGPVLYCFSPGVYPKPGSYMFSAGASTASLTAALVRYFRDKGWTRLAILTSSDASGQDGRRQLLAALHEPANKDIKLVAEEQFNPTAVSVAAQIERIKAAHPQALIAWSSGSPIGTVYKGIIQGGLNIPVGTTDANMSFAQMKAYATFMPKESFFVTALWPPQPATVQLPPSVEKAKAFFFSAYKKYTGHLPDHGATTSWDPALIVLSALKKLGPNMTAQQLHNYISHLTDFAGVDGVYNFVEVPQRGLTPEDTVVTLWNAKDHAWEVVSRPGGAPLAN